MFARSQTFNEGLEVVVGERDVWTPDRTTDLSPDAQGQRGKQVPEQVSPRYRNRVLKVSSSYRSHSVKDEPDSYTTAGSTGSNRGYTCGYTNGMSGPRRWKTRL
jgi:hypothetical protein